MKRIYGRFLCIFLLLAFFILAFENARNASITVDEGLHIASGYTILVTGDYRLVEEHPPLVKLLLALPLLPIKDLGDPTELPAWDTSKYSLTESVPLLRMAQQLLYEHTPVDQWLYPARTMSIFIGFLGLSLLYRWANDLWGMNGGLLAISLAVFDPNIIAHSAIAGTDIGAAFFILLALWCSTKLIQKSNIKWTIINGFALGLALASKLTAILALIPVGLSGLIAFWKGFSIPLIRRTILNVLVLYIVAFITIWGIYLFQVGYIQGIPIPLPMPAHATPLSRLFQHSSEGHQAFLLGENRLDGWWYYFPIAYLVKTPIPTLIMFPVSIILALHKSLEHKRKLYIAAAIFFLIYTITSITSPLNIGYRHILPLLFLIYVSIGAFTKVKKPWVYVLFFILVFYQCINTISHTPYLLGWFNDLSGGPENGWRYLADSNTDWGQGYKALTLYQREYELPPINTAGFVFYDPAIYNLDYLPLPPMHGDTPPIFPSRFAPEPGYYAISLTSLDGIPLADNEMYDWFRWHQPADIIANAIHLYQITANDVQTDWIAQCTNPVTPLWNEVIQEGFGVNEDRRYIPFDCTQSWIIPFSPDQYGAYILHGSHLQNTLATKLHFTQPQAWDDLINAHLRRTKITYQQREYRENPSFGIFRVQPSLIISTPGKKTFWAAPADTPPLQPDHQFVEKTPVVFSGPLSLLGVNVIGMDQNYEVETWWLVNQQTTDAKPLSIMAHILDEDGEIMDIADGLGINPVDWITGDVIIQRHTFQINAGMTSGKPFIRLGLYWRESGERMELKDHSGIDAVYALLDE